MKPLLPPLAPGFRRCAFRRRPRSFTLARWKLRDLKAKPSLWVAARKEEELDFWLPHLEPEA